MVTQSCRRHSRTDFTAEVSWIGGITVVELTGELDISTAGELRECLVRSDVRDAPRVVIDLSDVTFMDSVGIGLIVTVSKRIRHSGGSVSVTCREGATRRLLEIEGLIEYLKVERRPLSMVEAWVELVQ